MEFKTSVRTCLAKFADFTGRALRAEFWWFYLAVIICYLLIDLVFGSGLFGVMIVLLFAAASLVPTLSAGVRRLHDTGRSGWFLLLGFVPLVNFYLLYLLARPGDTTMNNFGEPPLVPTRTGQA